MKNFVLFFLLSFCIPCELYAESFVPERHAAAAKVGAICAGPDYSKALPDKDIYIKIDNGEKQIFSGARGKILFHNLNLDKKYLIRIFKDNTQFSSLKLEFVKFKTNFVMIWKSSGAWRMDPVIGETCDGPKR